MTITDDGYEMVIGLEVHCELLTASKLFCSCANEFGAEANTHICPVCLGLPGSLPVLNRGAVELAMRIGLSLNCVVQPSIFHRKNYFYPDMPKDYQVSQYDIPINANGSIDLADGSRVGIIRAHIEEDTGKTLHKGGGGRIHGATYSLVDYNRAGVPLVEIVSAPDITSAEQARAYVRELRSILVATGSSDGRMEEGSLRIDANISVRPIGSTVFGTRCEVKNVNSLRSLGGAIDYEARRQVGLVSRGERVVQETRHWSEDDQTTSSMRSKEEANDYRYFPEPDLVLLAPEAGWIEQVRSDLPALPAARRARLDELFSGEEHSGEQVATVVELGLDDLVFSAVDAGADPRRALARTANEVAASPQAGRSLDPHSFAGLVKLESSGALSATQAKTVLTELLEGGGEPSAIAERLGFVALSADELEAVVDAVIVEHEPEWARYMGGDEKVAQFLLGQVMRRTSGRADGKAVAASLAKRRA